MGVRRIPEGIGTRIVLPVAVLVLHAALLLVMFLQLQVASDPPAQLGAHPHAPVADEGFGTRDPLVDLTPPEVRTLGGSGPAEVLEPAPAAEPPRQVADVERVEMAGARTLADQRIDAPSRGRAPPVD